MFEDIENFTDIFRLPYYLIFIFAILMVCSSNSVHASNEYKVYRMSQFDINGISYGCRASSLSLEAKSIFTWTTARHCVFTKFQDINIDQFSEIRQKAGGIVLLLPKNISEMSIEEKQHIYLLEQSMLSQPINIPVYFASYNSDLDKMIGDVTLFNKNEKQPYNKKRNNTFTELVSSISANGYQIIVTGATHMPTKNSKIPIIQGELSGKSSRFLEENNNKKTRSPLIVVTAHLNTFGVFNEYLLNSDTVILMILVEQFSKIFNVLNSSPKYRLLFLLTESGPLLNFQGAKKWLDENMQYQNVDFVLCLDTVVSSFSDRTESLFLHVSKPPKEGSAVNNFYKVLKDVSLRYGNVTIEGVHKKINLAEQQLAWEHERFSMKRLPAFTISSLKSAKDPLRTTVFKDHDEKLILLTQKYTKCIAEALVRFIFNIEGDGDIFADDLEISHGLIKSYFNIKSSLINNDLKNGFEKYLKNVKITFDKPDVRDPDFMLYDGQEARLNVYRVKPAVFDLFLTALISLYLSSVYLIIHQFPSIYSLLCKTRIS